jgi:hypothetical protein
MAAVGGAGTSARRPARIILTLVGAGGMVIGAYLSWVRLILGHPGYDLSFSVFYSTRDASGASFLGSAGFIVIVLSVLAVLGLAFRTGWLTSLAGALGIVAFLLFLITLYRGLARFTLDVSDVGPGMWLVFAGGLLALIGGFLGSRRPVFGPPGPTAPPA